MANEGSKGNPDVLLRVIYRKELFRSSTLDIRRVCKMMARFGGGTRCRCRRALFFFGDSHNKHGGAFFYSAEKEGLGWWIINRNSNLGSTCCTEALTLVQACSSWRQPHHSGALTPAGGREMETINLCRYQLDEAVA